MRRIVVVDARPAAVGIFGVNGARPGLARMTSGAAAALVLRNVIITRPSGVVMTCDGTLQLTRR